MQFPTPNTRLRIANVHLESLVGPSERTRALQLAAVALFLREEDDGVAAGIVAGNMNAVCPGDRGLPERVELGDAWKEVKTGTGTENGENGMGWQDGEEDYTWGYQPGCRFPPARLDKVLIVGRVWVEKVERVGVGLKMDVGVPRVAEEEEEGVRKDL